MRYKTLILGYKQKGRGKEFFSDDVKAKIDWLEKNIKEIIDKEYFDLVSFDNLALEQLKMKAKMIPEKWERMYMGDDGTFTFFVDLVNGVFACDSLTENAIPIDSAGWNVDNMFQVIRGGALCQD